MYKVMNRLTRIILVIDIEMKMICFGFFLELLFVLEKHLVDPDGKKLNRKARKLNRKTINSNKFTSAMFEKEVSL